MARTVTESEPPNDAAIGADDQGAYIQGGFMRTRSEKGKVDKLAISPKQAKQYGLKDSETPAWVRNPHHELYKRLGDDRVEEVLNEYDGARLVAPPGGTNGVDSIKRGPDLVLVAIPKSLTDAKQKAIDRHARFITQGLSETTDEYLGDAYEAAERTQVDGEDVDKAITRSIEWREARTRHQKSMHRRAGIVGGNSPTAGLSLYDAKSRYTPQQIAEDEAMYRGGGPHADLSRADFQNMIKRTASPSVRMSVNADITPPKRHQDITNPARKGDGARQAARR